MQIITNMQENAQFLPSVSTLSLTEAAVSKYLMESPQIFGLAAVLVKVEHWVFDRIDLSKELQARREARLAMAGTLLAASINRLDAGAALIDFLCSMSSRRRFVLIWYFEAIRPKLVQELAEYAFMYRHQQPNCAHYVHWLDVVSKSQLLARVFSAENVEAVSAILARKSHH